MLDDFSNITIISIQVIVISLLLYGMYRRYFFSVFDPLVFYIITQAFSIELAYLTIQRLAYFIVFLSFQISFYLGFICFSTVSATHSIDDTRFFITPKLMKLISIFTIVSIFIIICTNLYFIFLHGLVLLNDDPTVGKVSMFEGGGLGAIRRINWGLLNFTNVLALFLFLQKRKKIYLVSLLILLFITIAGGSKGGILNYVFLLAFAKRYPRFSKSNYFKNINKIQVSLVLLGGLTALFIISTSTSSMVDAFGGLMLRFLYFGDSILYYFTPASVAHFKAYNVFDFLSYELNPILGLTRIVPYKQPLGYDMVVSSLKSNEVLNSVVGPNVPYYIKGHMFFGSFGGLIYSFFVGGFVGFFRKILFRASGKRIGYLKIFVLIYVNLILFTFPQDSSLFISYLTDTVIFGLIPLFVAYMFIINVGDNPLEDKNS